MHQSRLGVIVIDCQGEDLAEPVRFWSAALGYAFEIGPDGKYAEGTGPAGEPRVLLQHVTHASRVHLDIETDDKAAERTRLEALGARLVEEHPRWFVMEAPTGHRFCVVNPQRPDFPGGASAWPDGS
jgi:hypothetical protein